MGISEYNTQLEEEIPLSARIVTVADFFDDLTSVGCYKSAFTQRSRTR